MNRLLDVSVSTVQSRPRFHRRRARSLRLLGQLNEYQLSDLGISLADRLNELDKPFWR
jgi:uncharacterized protein YjiS (DUF1127 family)